MVHFQNVSKFILSDVNVHIPKGISVGVIGASGSGKTTFLKLACGLLEAKKGKVRTLHRNPVNSRKKLAADVRAYFTDLPLFQGEDTVSGNFQTVQISYLENSKEYWERYSYLSERLGFSEFENKTVNQLSVGQRRRAELGATLIGNAELFLLDEPVNGLDVQGKLAFWELLRRQKESGATILVSSHNLTEITEFCDRILLLDEGKLIYYGDAERLFRKYAPESSLKLIFEGNLPDMEDLPLIRYCINSNMLTIEYDSNRISAAEIMKTILAQTTICEMKTIRPELADIITKRKGEMEI